MLFIIYFFANMLLGGFGVLLPLCLHWFYRGNKTQAWVRILVWLPVGMAFGFLGATMHGSVVLWGHYA